MSKRLLHRGLWFPSLKSSLFLSLLTKQSVTAAARNVSLSIFANRSPAPIEKPSTDGKRTEPSKNLEITPDDIHHEMYTMVFETNVVSVIIAPKPQPARRRVWPLWIRENPYLKDLRLLQSVPWAGDIINENVPHEFEWFFRRPIFYVWFSVGIRSNTLWKAASWLSSGKVLTLLVK